MNENNLCEMIKFHRKKSGLTQEGLASLAGVGKTVVFDIEKGRLTFKYTTLLRILHVLNIQIDFISPLMKIYKGQL